MCGLDYREVNTFTVKVKGFTSTASGHYCGFDVSLVPAAR
jgi:hypothetical protein